MAKKFKIGFGEARNGHFKNDLANTMIRFQKAYQSCISLKHLVFEWVFIFYMELLIFEYKKFTFLALDLIIADILVF